MKIAIAVSCCFKWIAADVRLIGAAVPGGCMERTLFSSALAQGCDAVGTRLSGVLSADLYFVLLFTTEAAPVVWYLSVNVSTVELPERLKLALYRSSVHT
jgi:hypothetical protein